MVVDPPGVNPPTTPLVNGDGPMSGFLFAAVTLARGKSTGELAVVLNETSPTRLPVPARTNCTKSEAAARASWIFV